MGNLVLDGASPAIVYSSGSNTVVTAAFDAPANSLLVVAMSGNTFIADSPTVPVCSGGGLSYTLVQHSAQPDGSAAEAQAALLQANNTSLQNMTIQTQMDASSVGIAVKVWVWTDDGGGLPTVGASVKGADNTARTSIAQGYTALGNGSRGVLVYADWNATSAPTAGTGCTLTGGGSAVQTTHSYAFALRTTADGVAGAVTTLNISFTSTDQNRWAVAEIVPTATAIAVAPRSPRRLLRRGSGLWVTTPGGLFFHRSNHPTDSVAPATSAPAEAATASASALDAAADVTANAQAVTANAASQDANASVAPAAEAATATATAQDASAALTVNAEAATATAAAGDPAGGLGANAEAVAASASAFDATVTTVPATNAPAEAATATATASDANASIGANAEAATATATALDASTALAVNAEAATASVTAGDATVSTATVVNAPAGAATAAAAALDAATAITAAGEAATATAGAFDTAAGLGANAGGAAGTVAAFDPTVSTQPTTNAAAGVASATGVALDAGVAIAILAELASATGVAYDATALITGKPPLYGVDGAAVGVGVDGSSSGVGVVEAVVVAAVSGDAGRSAAVGADTGSTTASTMG